MKYTSLIARVIQTQPNPTEALHDALALALMLERKDCSRRSAHAAVDVLFALAPNFDCDGATDAHDLYEVASYYIAHGDEFVADVATTDCTDPCPTLARSLEVIERILRDYCH